MSSGILIALLDAEAADEYMLETYENGVGSLA
jgi:hypothetical protein